MKPYTYLIGWRHLDTWYYGVRFAKNCSPDDLWTKYKTSSHHVKEFAKQHGDPDVIRVHKLFDSKDDACEYEDRFLRRVKAHKNPRFLNQAIGNQKFATHGNMLGKKHSAETNAKRVASYKRTINDPGYSRPTITDETRLKMSQSRKGVPKSASQREIMKQNGLKGSLIAAELNRGRKRPAHSEFMRIRNEINSPRYKTPLGDFRKFESPYSFDLLHEWCKNPDKVITKISISKSMKKNQNLLSYEWVGKTRREVGFSEKYFLSSDAVAK